MSSAQVRRAAINAYKTGLCVIPPRGDGTKRPVGDWAEYQINRPSRDQMERWYPSDGSGPTGVGIVAGAVSGGVEVIDFDDADTYESFKVVAKACGLTGLIDRIEDGYLEETPSGGVHWVWRCSEIGGNEKLARRPKRPDEMRNEHDTVKVLIETRGEGGFAVLAPSNGSIHPSGKSYRLLRGGFSSIAEVTPGERGDIFQLARSFDGMPPRDEQTEARAFATEDARPGDDFNARATWGDILEPAGWTRVYERGGRTYWRRPGKAEGISATTNHGGYDLLYVFSTSTVFEPEQGYSKWRAYAVMNHNGDWSAAARDLRAKGYGAPDAPFSAQLSGIDATEPRATSQLVVTPYPAPMADAAFHGLAGEIVRAIEPETEADAAALLLTFLAAVGNIVGTGPHWRVGGGSHGLRIWPVFVGQSSKARKGTSWSAIRPVLESAADLWFSGRVSSGLSSGEGLIYAVRDAQYKSEPIKEKGRIVGYQDVLADSGVDDKRLLVLEEEFAGVLKNMGRDGNILSVVIRQAWDSGDLRTLTKNNPLRATGAHIGVIGHVTQDELLRYLTSTEAGNGFANRFLWVCVKRARLLPDGGYLHPDTIAHLGRQLRQVIQTSEHIGLIERDEQANELWREVYGPLSEGGAGLLGVITSRAEAQVMRLASLYAVLDETNTISPDHLNAALAVWEYCESSARFIFGDRLGDPDADTILDALRREGEMTQTDISTLFGRNLSAARIERALAKLAAASLVTHESRPTKGRPATYWRAAC